MPEEPIDNRNIIDYFKYWTTDAIKANLDTKRHNFSVLISNKLNDFNIGSVIRNSNAFLAKEVIIYGRKKFDRRGAVGTNNYENLKYVKFAEELNFQNSVVIGVDNIENSIPIETFTWPKQHVIMAFGQEQHGLPEEIIKICKNIVYISQFGSVRSLNVGCASGIAMFSYCLQHGGNKQETTK
jgi:tRNA G18 (ribose-2'-O)-methylase SpoU